MKARSGLAEITTGCLPKTKNKIYFFFKVLFTVFDNPPKILAFEFCDKFEFEIVNFVKQKIFKNCEFCEK